MLFICLAICPSSVPASVSDFLSSLFRLSSAWILLSVQLVCIRYICLSARLSSVSHRSICVVVSHFFLCPLSPSSVFLSVPVLSYVTFAYLSPICLCHLYLSWCLLSSSPVLFTHILYLTIYASSVSFRFPISPGWPTHAWTNLIEEYFGLVL